MGGGLIQLVAYGAQDVYLTSNPQITFFKHIYRRHTNFSIESIKCTFLGKASFGNKVTAVIPRNGDLLYKTYIRVVLSGATATGDAKWAWVKYLGHALLRSVELSIGGQRIDLHTSDWLQIWYELSSNKHQENGYNKLVGNIPSVTVLSTSHDETVLNLPLVFFFCKLACHALPLIALQYHEVKLDVTFESLENLIVSSGFTTSNPGAELNLQIRDASLYCDMIFLDTDERKRFAQSSHETLIDVVQYTGSEGAQVTNHPLLNFNHPVKEIIWATHCGRFSNKQNQHKYLWYHPTDVDAMRLIATKRFALAVAKYDNSNNLVLNNSSLIAASGLPSALVDKLDAIQAVSLTITPSIENISILGDLLSLEDISIPVADFLFGVTRPTSGHGAAQFDVTLHMPFNYGLYIDGSINPTERAVLQLNGNDRFSERDGTFFNYIQPFQHHSNTPSDGINVYSFALKPEENQPSGTLNFSRIDNAILNFTLAKSNTEVSDFRTIYLKNDSYFVIYALSYNILRMASGMAGLAYSN